MSDESEPTALKSEQTESVQLTFRPVTELDLPGLEWDGEYRHFRQLYADTFQRTRLGITQMWVAVDSTEKIIGQVFVQLNSGNPDMADGKTRAYVFGFRVRDDYRSLGIGSLMMGFVENDLRQRGFTIVCLNVAKDNPRAIFLYQRLGYLIQGPDPGTWSYQDDAGNTHYIEEPAWRMIKILVSASQTEK